MKPLAETPANVVAPPAEEGRPPGRPGRPGGGQSGEPLFDHRFDLGLLGGQGVGLGGELGDPLVEDQPWWPPAPA